MIQRIQTVYLSISTILIGLLFLLPFAELAKEGAIYLFNFKGVLLDGVVKETGLIVTGLIVIIIVLQVLAMFRFKNRKQQNKIILFAILMLLCLLATLVYYTYFLFAGAQISYKIGTVLPLIAIVIDYLAIRAISKDEALIRSIDRIR